MRISELSERSGVAVATIKFYAREGLLPPGEKTSPNQASYNDRHVARLALIRAMIEVGALPVSSVKAILAAVDDETVPLGAVVGTAALALPIGVVADDSAGLEAVRAAVARRGWVVEADNPAWRLAARVLDDYIALGRSDLIRTVDAYAEAAEAVAAADLDAVRAIADQGREAVTETVVVGTVLGDALFTGLRRLAHEDASRRTFPVPGDPLIPFTSPEGAAS